MLFKNWLLLPLTAISILTSVGCTEFLNGKKAEPEVLEFSDKKFACLQVLPEQLGKFSVGEAQEKEIREGFDCMSEALTYFNEKTFGSMPDAYTVEEMRRFFGKYFLKENNVTPEFASELMKIKKALLGGSEMALTKDEIVRLVELLQVLREEAVSLSSHMSVLLNQKVDSGAEWEQISAAMAQLRSSLRILLAKSQVADSDYSFEDAKGALAGFAEFIRGQQAFAPYDKFSSWVPMAESVKIVLMGRRANFNGLFQWGQSLDSVLELYEMSLKYMYVLSDLEFNNPAKLRQATQFVSQGLNLLLHSHQMKTSGYISLEDLDQLVDHVLPSLTQDLSPRAIKKTYRIVLMKILDPERKKDARSLKGLERKHILTLQTELNVWRLHQSFIDLLPFENSDRGFTQQQLLEAYVRFDKKRVIEKGLSEDTFEQKVLEDAWADIGELIKDPRMVRFDEDGRLLVSHAAASSRQDWATLTRFNVMRTLSRLLMLGYAEDVYGPLSRARLSEKGLSSWYEDFHEIGLELKAFDPRAENSGPRSFLEANFFTFNGNGDDVMDQKETFEFVTMLLSAGMGTSNEIVKHMQLAGCSIQDKDVFGFPYLEQKCFKQQLKKHFEVYFGNLPGLVRYIDGLNGSQWDQFFGYLLAASVVPDQKKGFLETANVRSIITILHYMESIYITYDRDRNQALSVEEVYAAAPRFMSFFKKVSPTSMEFLIKEGFAHLVFFGEIPGAGGVFKFQWEKLWGIEDAQRMEMARLFGTLKDQLNTVKN